MLLIPSDVRTVAAVPVSTTGAAVGACATGVGGGGVGVEVTIAGGATGSGVRVAKAAAAAVGSGRNASDPRSPGAANVATTVGVAPAIDGASGAEAGGGAAAGAGMTVGPVAVGTVSARGSVGEWVLVGPSGGSAVGAASGPSGPPGAPLGAGIAPRGGVATAAVIGAGPADVGAAAVVGVGVAKSVVGPLIERVASDAPLLAGAACAGAAASRAAVVVNVTGVSPA